MHPGNEGDLGEWTGIVKRRKTDRAWPGPARRPPAPPIACLSFRSYSDHTRPIAFSPGVPLMASKSNRTSRLTTEGTGPRPQPGHAARRRLSRRRLQPPHDRRRLAVQRHHALQRPPRPPGPQGRRGHSRRRRRAADLRRPDRLRRHHDGPSGHALQPGVARGHRRQHRGRRRRHEPRRRAGVGGCDKNMPGCVMAMARLNVPSIFVYGGSILPGIGADGSDIDIVSIFEAVGQYQAGKLDAAGRPRDRVRGLSRAPARAAACTPPTPCRRAIEAMGMSLPYDASYPGRLGRQGARDVPGRPGAGAAASRRTSARATSSRASRWRTPTRSCWRWAARPTPCCT